MREAVTISGSDPLAVVRAIRELGREGASSPRVRELLRDVRAAAASCSCGCDGDTSPRALLELAARELQRRVSWIPELPGKDTIQAPELTLEVGAGDCDDHAALVVAVARALGLSSRVVLVSERSASALVARHVYAEVLAGSSWVPVDTTLEGKPYGVAPTLPAGFVLERAPEDAPRAGNPGNPLVALAAPVVGGVLSLFGASKSASAARDAAAAQERAATKTANAARIAAQLQADAQKQASADALGAVRIQTALEEQRLQAARESVRGVLQVAARIAPALAVFLVLKAAAPLVGALK